MKKLLTLILLSSLTSEASFANDCGHFLAEAVQQAEMLSDTNNFLSYLSALLKERVIEINYVRDLEKQLAENHQLINPFGTLYTRSEQIVHRPTFQYYIEQTSLDKKLIKNWVRDFLQQHENIKKEKNTTQEKTVQTDLKIQFNLLPKGNFYYHNHQIPGEIKEDFALMAAPMTQRQWFQLAMLAQNQFRKKDFPEIEDSLPSHFRQPIGNAWRSFPDNPVESLSLDMAKNFIAELNQLSQHSAPEVQEKLKEIIDQHQAGDIYDLPDVMQIMYVRTNLGTNDHFIKFGQDHEAYDWTTENSDNITHPIAEKRPYTVNGNLFYDLDGNVSIWTKSEVLDYQIYLNQHGANLKFLRDKGLYIYIGSNWNFERYKEPPPAFFEATEYLSPESKSHSVGVRLVRYRR